MDSPIAQPYECPSIYIWLQSCLTTRSSTRFPTLPGLVSDQATSSERNIQDREQWLKLTPKTLIFKQFFEEMQAEWTSAKYVEALSSAGADLLFLETLPEAILAPLQETIIHCQTEPPSKWSKDLLALVGREDVTMLLTPGQRPRYAQSTILVGFDKRVAISMLIGYRRLLMRPISTFMASAPS